MSGARWASESVEGGDVGNGAGVAERQAGEREEDDGEAVPELGRTGPPLPDTGPVMPVWKLRLQQDEDGSGDDAGQRADIGNAAQRCAPPAAAKPAGKGEHRRRLDGREDKDSGGGGVAPARGGTAGEADGD